jgi:hypothetical protein
MSSFGVGIKVVNMKAKEKIIKMPKYFTNDNGEQQENQLQIFVENIGDVVTYVVKWFEDEKVNNKKDKG